MCCLSSCSYIKPQQLFPVLLTILVVYHLVPTSNHNLQCIQLLQGRVVYHLVPTSNHNLTFVCPRIVSLFIILFLHQTTTGSNFLKLAQMLFIILFLHQTTTSQCSYLCGLMLFIILFLHQTTTGALDGVGRVVGCLSSCSYIKPQPIAVNLLAISKILCFKLLRNGRAGRILLQKY